MNKERRLPGMRPGAIPAPGAAPQISIPRHLMLSAPHRASRDIKRGLGARHRKHQGLSLRPAMAPADGSGCAVPEIQARVRRRPATRPREIRFEPGSDSTQIDGRTPSLSRLNERAFQKQTGHSVSATCHSSEDARFLFSQIIIKLELK